MRGSAQTSEWDTAAGQAILAAAGGSVTTLDGRAAAATARGTPATPTPISSPGRGEPLIRASATPRVPQ